MSLLHGPPPNFAATWPNIYYRSLLITWFAVCVSGWTFQIREFITNWKRCSPIRDWFSETLGCKSSPISCCQQNGTITDPQCGSSFFIPHQVIIVEWLLHRIVRFSNEANRSGKLEMWNRIKQIRSTCLWSSHCEAQLPEYHIWMWFITIQHIHFSNSHWFRSMQPCHICILKTKLKTRLVVMTGHTQINLIKVYH